jgi:hypothetical protein
MSIILRVDGLLGKITGTVYGGQVKKIASCISVPKKLRIDCMRSGISLKK